MEAGYEYGADRLQVNSNRGLSPFLRLEWVEALVMKKLMSLDEMEPIAKEAMRLALGEYPEPSKEDQSDWTLGKFETEGEGVFEIYIPTKQPLDAKVISRTRVNRKTGVVNVEVFLKS